MKLLIFLILIMVLPAIYAKEQCLIITKDNIDESANGIWSSYSNMLKFNGNPDLILEAALNDVDSLKEGNNGYGFKEELKIALRKIYDNYKSLPPLTEKEDCEISSQTIDQKIQQDLQTPKFQKISGIYGQDIAIILLKLTARYCSEDPSFIIQRAQEASALKVQYLKEIKKNKGTYPFDLNILRFFDDSKDKNFINSLLAESSIAQPDTLAVAALKEGLNDWIDLVYYKNPSAKIDGYKYLGLWDFETDVRSLKEEGFLRDNFNEYKIQNRRAIFNNLNFALEAFSANIAWRMAIFLRDARDNGYDINSLTEDQVNYWTYFYYNCGVNCGKDRLLSKGINIPVKSRHEAHLNSKKVLATINYIQAMGLFPRTQTAPEINLGGGSCTPDCSTIKKVGKLAVNFVGIQTTPCCVCIDDYSLKEKDDCWNKGALCKQGECRTFESMEYDGTALEALGQLKNDDPNERIKSIETLGYNAGSMSNNPCIMALIHTLQRDPVALVRGRAAYTLGIINGHDEKYEPLIKALQSDPSNIVRIFAKYALMSSSYEGYIPPSTVTVSSLIDILRTESDDPLLVATSVMLGKSGAQEALQLLETDDISIQTKTLIAAFYINNFLPTLEAGDSRLSSPYLETVLWYSPLDPEKTLEILLTFPYFNKIFNHPLLERKTKTEKNSISISVYRYIRSNYGNNPTDQQIILSIYHILSKREKFYDKVIVGQNTYFLVLSHKEFLHLQDEIKDFVRKRGVKEENIYLLKDGLNIKDAIISTGDKGSTTIWVNTHGEPDFILPTSGYPPQISYDEFADILLQRGNLDEVTLIIDSCFSYNFAEQLIQNLKEKGSIKYPTIITETNKGKFGYLNTFIEALEKTILEDNVQLRGSHIYEAEYYQFSKQDTAVFFSEDGTSPPLEIAMNTLNPSQCIECEGDSCPIESVERISS